MTPMVTPGTIRLVIEDEGGTRSTVPFTDDALIVGRAEEGVAFRLSDRNVSRRHARFFRANGAVHVEDLGSLTGTRVNGERITGRRRLREGDLVQIGDYDLALFGETETGVPGEPPPLPPTPRPQTEAAPPSALPPAIAEGVAVARAAPHAATPRPAPLDAGRGTAKGQLLRACVMAALALALGAAAGYAAGVATAPSPASPSAITRP